MNQEELKNWVNLHSMNCMILQQEENARNVIEIKEPIQGNILLKFAMLPDDVFESFSQIMQKLADYSISYGAASQLHCLIHEHQGKFNPLIEINPDKHMWLAGKIFTKTDEVFSDLQSHRYGFMFQAYRDELRSDKYVNDHIQNPVKGIDEVDYDDIADARLKCYIAGFLLREELWKQANPNVNGKPKLRVVK